MPPKKKETSEKPLNRAVIYARYSPGPNQRDESIEGQLRECKAVAKRAGLLVIDTYIDKKMSGTNDNRPSFQKMLKDSARGLFDVVITWKIDRFARNRYDSAIYKHELNKNGVKILYAKEHIPEGPEGVILESVLEGMAEWYSKNLSQNIRRGLRDNALKCRAVGGRVPLGYDLAPDKTFLINEKTVPIIREIFTRYAAGDRAIDICTDLNARGIRTGSGGTFNRSSLHRILAQEKYTGLYKYEDIVIPNGVPRIISDELFKAAQDRVNFNKMYVKNPPSLGNEFILTGRIFCGCCGGPLNGMSGTGKTAGTYYYYTCHNKRNKKQKCEKRNIRKDYLEPKISAAIKAVVLSNTAVIDQIIDRCLEIQAQNRKADPAAGLRVDLLEVKKSIKNIYAAIEAGILTPGLGERLKELETRATDLEAAIYQAEIERPEVTREQLEFIFEKYRSLPDTPELVSRLLDTFVNSVYVFEDRAVVNFNLSGDTGHIIPLSTVKDFEFTPAKNLEVGSPVVAKTPLYATETNPVGRLEFTAFLGGFALVVAL